jgi:NADP-dependent alcohol dehydrogenase
MNPFAVFSRSSLGKKKDFTSVHSFAPFSIIDPTVTYSLSDRYIINGIIDPFVHVTEQYLTFDVNSPLQNRQSEAILITLIEEAAKVFKDPNNYDVRANLTWCATQALNGLIGKGVPQDWATHAIGHELTALYGLDHAQTLAIVLPALLKNQFENKKQRLAQYAKAVFKLNYATEGKLAKAAIDKTEKFFRSLGCKTRLNEYGIPKKDIKKIATKVLETSAGKKLGEKKSIGQEEVIEILELSYSNNS